jgi:hypothetical protein
VKHRWRHLPEPVDGERGVVARSGIRTGPKTSPDHVLERLGGEISEAVHPVRQTSQHSAATYRASCWRGTPASTASAVRNHPFRAALTRKSSSRLDGMFVIATLTFILLRTDPGSNGTYSSRSDGQPPRPQAPMRGSYSLQMVPRSRRVNDAS